MPTGVDPSRIRRRTDPAAVFNGERVMMLAMGV
jgi:hypothetical protein